ncbi:hypothetical protein [Nocardia wallacei]|uniref:hypothetical protein n=1 Tax=Nocardia wallacei TaxID=480035 RepID=UPI00313B5653
MTANVAGYLLQLLAGRWLGVGGYSEFASLLAVQLLCAVPALALQNVVARELVRGASVAAVRALGWRCAAIVAALAAVLIPVVAVVLEVSWVGGGGGGGGGGRGGVGGGGGGGRGGGGGPGGADVGVAVGGAGRPAGRAAIPFAGDGARGRGDRAGHPGAGGAGPRRYRGRRAVGYRAGLGGRRCRCPARRRKHEGAQPVRAYRVHDRPSRRPG